MLYGIVSVAGSLAAYVLYNAMFFSLVSHVLNRRPARWKTDVAACAANFGAFIVVSALELPLAVNWSLVALLFLFEIKLLYRAPWADCALGALIGATIGLASTLIMRSSCALILNLPMSAVNNAIASFKALPVSLGFLMAAGIARIVDAPRSHRVLGAVLAERRVALFLLVEAALCYLYLCSNFLLYYSNSNDFVTKLWTLKTALFVSLGVLLAVWFAYRMASVLGQARRRDALSREIALDQQTNARLQELAEHDALTGCFTRGYAERALPELLQAGKTVTVVFADLDGLKEVNDRFGHDAGDAYLAAAASALGEARGSSGDFVARYGGDEFLAVLTEPLPPALVAERMEVASHSLQATGREGGLPYEPSMSWGHAVFERGDDVADVIVRADEAMYRRKHGAR